MTERIINKPESDALALHTVDLNLYVFDRPLHPELFPHYAAYRVSQGRYHADVSIIGLGHLVTVSTSEGCLTELLSRPSESLPSRGILTRFRLKGERDHERTTPDNWVYLVSTQVEQMDEALYKSVHFDLLRHAEKRGRLVTYENTGVDSELTPFTYVDHEARDSEFHVHAFHAFPHERTLVKTQSIIEVPPL